MASTLLFPFIPSLCKHDAGVNAWERYECVSCALSANTRLTEPWPAFFYDTAPFALRIVLNRCIRVTVTLSLPPPGMRDDRSKFIGGFLQAGAAEAREDEEREEAIEKESRERWETRRGSRRRERRRKAEVEVEAEAEAEAEADHHAEAGATVEGVREEE